ncbi:MAG: N-acetyltransferase [Proteobacteria bacterium]|nr:N-acetyltransferase [Pseudomonadota bacterium]NDC23933.1 N-acetyltransferase [Pseudomonadota bacterium]NDD03480.1 N-acetyltransferase [Pseudomonadota bacterium]NDG26292.1 N-acetyltransferase [Pseudomonadota bacterium]
MNLSLRPATLEDAQRLLDWRNDIQTRLNSFNKEEVSWLDHVEWLKKSLQSSDRKIIIVEWGDLSVGTIRLDSHSDHIELSWTVAPEHRGKGYGSQMLQAACQLIKSGKIIAKIHSGNMPSIQMAKRSGFKPLDMNEEWQTWVLEKKPSLL